ncbi:Lactonase, 7-bladed beta-propeller-domain-containing protein [Melanogaster broomeanus]|nr:Lactonase, 7-bladed beta-propeller-domain-containing protein [Melanogaster broomeanus]
MAPHKILVGSYSDSIYTLEIPTLKLLDEVKVGHHPSWIVAHPSDSSLIFTGLEQSDGEIVVVKYGKDGKGHKVEEATCSSGGSDPCTLLVTENELLIGNYSSGTLATLPISATPPYTHPAALWTLSLPFDEKPGRNESRQDSSHPHQIVFNPLNTTETELLIPDLGADKVWRLTKGLDGHWAIQSYVHIETGGGPRHVATYGNTLYTLLELTSQLAVHKFHSVQQPLTHLTTLSTIKASPPRILIPTPNTSFPTPYVYASNRNDPSPEGDTIAIFSVANGEEKPELVTEVRTGLSHVRGMVFGGEHDKWLVVGGAGFENRGVGVKVFERVDGGKGLKQLTELDKAVGSTMNPTAFLWV